MGVWRSHITGGRRRRTRLYDVHIVLVFRVGLGSAYRADVSMAKLTFDFKGRAPRSTVAILGMDSVTQDSVYLNLVSVLLLADCGRGLVL